jgi:uncharacterized protein (DUF1778 family)
MQKIYDSITASVTVEEKKSIKKAAKSAGETPSMYVKKAVLARMESESNE